MEIVLVEHNFGDCVGQHIEPSLGFCLAIVEFFEAVPLICNGCNRDRIDTYGDDGAPADVRASVALRPDLELHPILKPLRHRFSLDEQRVPLRMMSYEASP